MFQDVRAVENANNLRLKYAELNNEVDRLRKDNLRLSLAPCAKTIKMSLLYINM